MESDAFVSVCDGSSGQPQVFIVDLKNGNQVMKRPMSAEAAIMNPVSKILALRAGQQLQIFNLELRAKMKSHQMPETVVFWRWVSPSTIALVTPTAVFHWSTEGSSAPSKVFDRHAQLGEGTQVINYQVSPDEKWCLLMGISHLFTSPYGPKPPPPNLVGGQPPLRPDGARADAAHIDSNPAAGKTHSDDKLMVCVRPSGPKRISRVVVKLSPLGSVTVKVCVPSCSDT